MWNVEHHTAKVVDGVPISSGHSRHCDKRTSGPLTASYKRPIRTYRATWVGRPVDAIAINAPLWESIDTGQSLT